MIIRLRVCWDSVLFGFLSNLCGFWICVWEVCSRIACPSNLPVLGNFLDCCETNIALVWKVCGEDRAWFLPCNRTVTPIGVSSSPECQRTFLPVIKFVIFRSRVPVYCCWVEARICLVVPNSTVVVTQPKSSFRCLVVVVGLCLCSCFLWGRQLRLRNWWS